MTAAGGTEAVVDLRAFRRNVTELTRRVSPAEVMVVVKDDAYGHGILPLALAAVEAGARWIGSFDVANGLLLRNAGIGPEIRIFAWMLVSAEDFRHAIGAQIDMGVSSLGQLEHIAAAGRAGGDRARVHLKVDTGLHRNGATPEDWPALVERAAGLQAAGVIELVGAWTHIAEASDHEDTLAIARFEKAISVARAQGVGIPLRHLAASAAGLARQDARFDLVRFGAFCYGIPPGDGGSAREMGLEQTMTLRSEVTGLVASGGTVLGSVPLGFAHGLPTRVIDGLTATLNGVRHPVRGPIELDQLWVDFGAAAVSVGDPVILWGPGDHGEQTLQEWARVEHTMGEEIVVRLSPSIPRRYEG